MIPTGEHDLESEKNAILDASHRLSNQRLRSYRLEFNHSDSVIYLLCGSADQNTVRKRLVERKQRDDPYSEATEFNTYRSTVEIADDPLEDPPVDHGHVAVLRYDSINSTVHIMQIVTAEPNVVDRISEQLRRLIQGGRKQLNHRIRSCCLGKEKWSLSTSMASSRTHTN